MEDKEIMVKPIYKSKKDILNKILRIKTEKDDNISDFSKIHNPFPFPKKYSNLGKKNLTYQNFLEYTYDYNNLTGKKKIKMPNHLKIKQKYELMLDSEYPSIISKNPNKKITPLLITGLNTATDNKYNKLNNIFSKSQKSFENNSDLKTKSSSNKFTRSIFFNFNSSNKNDFLYPSDISKSIIHFHSEIDKFTKNDNKDEGLKAFVQKSKIILKEKIIKQDLRDKLTYHNDVHKEEIKLLNQREKNLYRKIELLDKFENDLIHYLRYLKQEEADEMRSYHLLNKIKIDLENDVIKLHKKIEKLDIELTRFDSLKRFFKFSKTGIASLPTKEREDKENNKDKIIKDKIKEEKKQVITNKQINDFRKNFFGSMNQKLLSYRRPLPGKQKEGAKKNFYFKCNSLKPLGTKLETKLILDDAIKKIEKQVQSKKESSNKRKSRRKSSLMVHQKQYENMFTNVENKILKNIEIYNSKENQLVEERKILKETKGLTKDKNKYTDEMIKQKEIIASKILEKNEELNKKLNSFSKMTKEKELSSTILEKKMIQIINNIKPQLNLGEILKIKNLSFMIELEPKDFLERFRTSKIIFLIKIIELIISYLISKKSKYLSEPKLKVSLKNFLFKLENDKKIRMNKLNKKILKTEMENKKAKDLERATKIRFLSYRKMDLSHFKNKRHKALKEKEYNKTVNDYQYEDWILYD